MTFLHFILHFFEKSITFQRATSPYNTRLQGIFWMGLERVDSIATKICALCAKNQSFSQD